MRLFISYARANKKKVHSIVRIMEEGGHDPWFDHKLIPFQDWQQQLLEQIRLADAFVYMLSHQSVESSWCKWEYCEAIELGKPICPIRVDNFKYPPELIELSKIHFVDCLNDITGESVAQLMRGFQDVAQKLTNSINVPSPHQSNELPAQLEMSSLQPIDQQNISRLTKLTTLQKDGESRFDSISFSYDGRFLASCSYGLEARVDIWDVYQQKIIHSIEDLPRRVEKALFSPSSNLLVCFCEGIQYIVDIDNDYSIHDLGRYFYDSIVALSFNMDASLLAAHVRSGEISFWELPSFKHLNIHEVIADWDFDRDHDGSGIAFSPDGKLLVCGLKNTLIHIWDIEKQKVVKVLYDHDYSVWDIAFSHNGQKLSAVDIDGNICIWEVSSFQLIQRLRISTEVGRYIFFSPNDKLLIALIGNTVSFWETNRFKHIFSFIPHENGKFTQITLSHDGSLLASCDKDGTIRLWGIPN